MLTVEVEQVSVSEDGNSGKSSVGIVRIVSLGAVGFGGMEHRALCVVTRGVVGVDVSRSVLCGGGTVSKWDVVLCPNVT